MWPDRNGHVVSYPRGCLDHVGPISPTSAGTVRSPWVSDAPTAARYEPTFYVARIGRPKPVTLRVPAGERREAIRIARSLWASLASYRIGP